MTTAPTPPKLRKAKAAAVTAAAMATTAAVTFGVTSPTIHARPDQQIAAAAEMVNADVDLTAVAGFYGVGPIFWVANALGITPQNLVTTLVEQLDNPALNDTVGRLFDALGMVVETGAPGPLPGDVYNAVNGLDYTTDLVLGLVPAGMRNIHLGPLAPAVNLLLGTNFSVTDTVGEAVEALANEVPILKQRRAVIFSEGFGGITTSLAYRDMIAAVTGDRDDWEPGVTGQWLVFINNPSRPGGGMAALLTPFTNLFGLNLSTPEGGSYTNDPDDPTKILNTSVLDITAAYNMWSDAPTTLNPLAWANAAAGGFLITYLIPDDLNLANTNIDPLGVLEPGNQIPILVEALANGLGVMVDPTGGQGTRVIPIVGDLIDLLNDIPLVNIPHLDGIKGESFFVTYDSGNLPILEPLDLLPRLLGLAGVNVPQPFHNSIEDALRMAINAGYQDVDPETLERGFHMGGDQALLWHSALTPSQQFDAGWTISNTLLDGIQENLLNPVKWTPSILGQAGFNEAAEALIQNAIAMAVSQFINEALDAGQDLAGEGFTALRDALKPLLDIADQLNSQAEAAIDDAMQVDTLDPAPAPAPTPATTLGGEGARLVSQAQSKPESDVKEPAQQLDAALDETPAPKPTLADLAPDVDLLGDSQLGDKAANVADALNPRKALREAAAEGQERVEKQVTKTQNSLRKANERAALVGDKLSKGDVGGAVKQVGDNIQNRVDRVKKDINNGVSKVTGKKSSDSNSDGGGSEKSSSKDAA